MVESMRKANIFIISASILSLFGSITSHAASPSDAPGYGVAPVCAMQSCEGDYPVNSVPALATAGAGQGARVANATSRPISVRLPGGGYQCQRIGNGCGGDIFVPANSVAEWNSFMAGHPNCVSVSPCAYGETFGEFGGWSASCGPVQRSRWIGCQRDDGRPVDASFCLGRGVEYQNACLPCPQTACSPMSDGGTMCVTDDQCGNLSSFIQPPTSTEPGRCPDGTAIPPNGICSSSPPTSSGACIGSFFVPGPGMVPINMVDKQFFWYATGNQQGGGDSPEWYGDIVQCNNGTASVIATGIGNNSQETFRTADRPWDSGAKQGCSGLTTEQVVVGADGATGVTHVPYSTSHGGFVRSVGATYMCWNGSLVVFGK